MNGYSVIIPTMWESDKIQMMLDVYEKNYLINEIIIINNNVSKTPNIEYFKTKILTKNKNIYVNPAWNWGATTSISDNIIIANDDIYYKKDY